MTDIEYLADNFDRMYLGLTEALDQGPLTEEAFWREFEVAIADDHDIFTQVGMSGINQATGNKKEFYQLCIKQMENPRGNTDIEYHRDEPEYRRYYDEALKFLTENVK